jgi:hypothetical protein
MSRCCGLEEYKGEKLKNKFLIGLGKEKKYINECPISYADWSLVSEAIECHTYREEGYLPYHYDEDNNRVAGILDQTLFFHQASNIVKSVKNQAEAESMADIKSKGKK